MGTLIVIVLHYNDICGRHAIPVTERVQVAVDRHQLLKSARQIAAACGPDDCALCWRQIASERLRIGLAWSWHQ
jgi:hypothetical protein